MTETDSYLLGRDDAEVERLTRQIVTLGSDSEAQLDRIGIKQGEKVVDLGCGPGGVLHLLAERVGQRGHVLGIDRGRHFVELARRFVEERGLAQVDVREGDAYDTRPAARLIRRRAHAAPARQCTRARARGARTRGAGASRWLGRKFRSRLSAVLL